MFEFGIFVYLKVIAFHYIKCSLHIKTTLTLTNTHPVNIFQLT